MERIEQVAYRSSTHIPNEVHQVSNKHACTHNISEQETDQIKCPSPTWKDADDMRHTFRQIKR